jgi:membrane protein DedA with SNARE-associated domain
MPIGKFILFSTLGAIPWSILLVWAGVQLGARWTDIRHTLQPYDLAILVLVILLVVGFIWLRLGRPGWRRGDRAA